MPRDTVWAQALTAERKAGYTAVLEALAAEMRQRYLPGSPAGDEPQLPGRHPRPLARRELQLRRPLPLRLPGERREEFGAPFARLDHFGGEFAVMWMRHTGRWWCLRSELPFEEALAMVTTEPVLRPPV